MTINLPDDWLEKQLSKAKKELDKMPKWKLKLIRRTVNHQPGEGGK